MNSEIQALVTSIQQKQSSVEEENKRLTEVIQNLESEMNRMKEMESNYQQLVSFVQSNMKYIPQENVSELSNIPELRDAVGSEVPVIAPSNQMEMVDEMNKQEIYKDIIEKYNAAMIENAKMKEFKEKAEEYDEIKKNLDQVVILFSKMRKKYTALVEQNKAAGTNAMNQNCVHKD